MTSLFISYSRKDSAFAHHLVDAFKGQDWDFWIDWEDIPPTVDWFMEIEKGIEQAGVFLFLVSPDSIRSRICRREIDHALKNGKRLIPIVVRDVKVEDTPTVLSHLNWIFIRESDDFDSGISKLTTAVKTDYDWVRVHSDLQIKALEWDRGRRDKSFLLRGTELQLAEFQLQTNAAKEPCPTDLQREYVQKSRQAAIRQRRIVSAIGILVMIALAILAAFGWYQRDQAMLAAQKAQAASTRADNNASTAVANEKNARAGELAALAISQREKQLDLSLLLSVEAFRTSNTLRTRSVLLDSTQTNPHLVQYVKGHGQPVSIVAFSPDGKTLALVSGDGSIILWDVDNNQPIGQPLKEYSGPVYSLAFSPERDSKLLASGGCGKPDPDDPAGCLEGKIVLWDVSNPGTPQVVGQHSTGTTSPVRSISFSPNGKILASASGSVFLWDLEKRGAVGHPLTSEMGSHRVAFSPSKDGKLLALGGSDGAIILWDIENQQPIGDALTSDGGPIMEIVFSPDGKTLASMASIDQDITLWDVSKGETIQRLVNRDHFMVTSLAFSPDGKTIASGRKHSTLDSCFYDITIWNIETGESTVQLVGHTGSVGSVAFSPDGKTLASASGDTSSDAAVILWSLESRQPIRKFLTGQNQPNEEPSTTSVFSPDGKIRASMEEKTINLWNIERNEQIGQLSRGDQNNFTGLAFSPDGTTLASGSFDGTITLWKVKDQKQLCTLTTGQEGFIHNINFSPDGRTLAASRDLGAVLISSHIIILFDVEKRQPVGQPLTGHSKEITSVAFSPDGKILTSKSEDHTILWNLDPKSWIDITCQRAGRNLTLTEWTLYFPGEEYHKTCGQYPPGE
jgi:WD40 repeat protein